MVDLKTLVSKPRRLSIVGLAKNSGKTTVLNEVIRHNATSKKMGVCSIGRDGEDIDAITLKKKPRIFIPSGSYCVTTDRLAQSADPSGAHLELVMQAGPEGVLGSPGVYQMKSSGLDVVLAGVNRVQKMQKVLSILEAYTDFVLIDGAFDRRSSSVPTLSDSVILATGGAVGNSIDLVVQRTMYQVELLSLPLSKELTAAQDRSARIIEGAFTDRLADRIIHERQLSFESQRDESLAIIVKDWTRVFVSPSRLRQLQKRNVCIYVNSAPRLLAVAANPFNPHGANLDSGLLCDALRRALKEAGVQVPSLDVLGSK